MFAYAIQPQSPMKVISDSFRLFKASFSKVWLWSVVFLFPFFAMFFSGIPASLLRSFSFSSILIVSVVAIAFFLLGQGVIYFKVHCVAVNGNDKFWLTIKRILAKAFPILIVGILWYMANVFVPLMVILLFSNPVIRIILDCASTAAIYVFILPTIFFAPLLVINKFSLLKAIKYGCLLVWNQWARTFFVVVLFNIFISACLTVLPYVLLMHGYRTVGIVSDFMVLYICFLFSTCLDLAQLHDLKLRCAQKTNMLGI